MMFLSWILSSHLGHWAANRLRWIRFQTSSFAPLQLVSPCIQVLLGGIPPRLFWPSSLSFPTRWNPFRATPAGSLSGSRRTWSANLRRLIILRRNITQAPLSTLCQHILIGDVVSPGDAGDLAETSLMKDVQPLCHIYSPLPRLPGIDCGYWKLIFRHCRIWITHHLYTCCHALARGTDASSPVTRRAER